MILFKDADHLTRIIYREYPGLPFYSQVWVLIIEELVKNLDIDSYILKCFLLIHLFRLLI